MTHRSIFYWDSISFPKYHLLSYRDTSPMCETSLMEKWAKRMIFFVCYHILGQNLSLPIRTANVREHHYQEWMAIFELLIQKNCRKGAYFFAFSRFIDAVLINLSFPSGKNIPSQHRRRLPHQVVTDVK